MGIDFLTDINKNYKDSLNYKYVDNFVVKVLWWHLVFFAVMVFTNSVMKIALYYQSPLAWRVISPKEAVVTMIIALLATLIPFFVKDKIKNHYLWRILVTVSLVLYSYLFVFISGGAIEMHFHFFIIAALLIIYADWRLGWILLILTALHHGILNYVAPGWVYYYGRNDFAVIAHGLPVLVTIIFTTVLCITSRKSLINLKETQSGLGDRTVELEKLKTSLEETVKNRTNELGSKVAELEQTNKLMVDRELKMIELKKEIEDLKNKSS